LRRYDCRSMPRDKNDPVAPQSPAQLPADSQASPPAFDPFDDPMAPPKEPCECYCLHCQRTFLSDRMWFQRVIGDKRGFPGFWMCPTPNCSGAGFQIDIYPTDPDHPANDGWFEFDEDEFDEEPGEDDVEIDSIEQEGDDADDAEYDPSESRYRELEESFGDEDDDLIEGDEWKLGLAPGDPVPPQTYWPEAQRREWEQEQKRYDGPDERPRILDWSDRDDRDDPDEEPDFNKDDIPF